MRPKLLDFFSSLLLMHLGDPDVMKPTERLNRTTVRETARTNLVTIGDHYVGV